MQQINVDIYECINYSSVNPNLCLEVYIEASTRAPKQKAVSHRGVTHHILSFYRNPAILPPRQTVSIERQRHQPLFLLPRLSISRPRRRLSFSGGETSTPFGGRLSSPRAANRIRSTMAPHLRRVCLTMAICWPRLSRISFPGTGR